jgi:DNA-binding CsgD family transcriptional regulator
VQHVRILIYLISFACGISLISFLIHLYPKYPKAYLKKYLIHIIALNILAVLSMFYRYLNLFSASPEVPYTETQISLYSIIFSFGIIVTFLNLLTFLMVLLELLEREKNWIFSILPLMGSIIVILLIIQGLWAIFTRGDVDVLMNNLIALDIASSAVILVCALSQWVFSSILRNLQRKILIKWFLTLYGFSFGFMLATALFKKSMYSIFYFSSGICFLILNLLPLIFLKRLLSRVEIRENRRISGREYDQIYAKYGITKREKEIIQLITSGKSNKETGEILYISVKTVKYHVYNIYRKLKIKNRIGLVNLIMKWNNFKS